METQITPAIVAVGYNRPDSMSRLLKSLKQASYPFRSIHLIISIDKSDASDSVYQVAENFEWDFGEKRIIKYSSRQGLRQHILKCGDLSYDYGAVIILEDDLVVSPSFYYYAFQACNYYENEEKVAGIALYSHSWNGYVGYHFIPEHNEFDTYMGQFSITWGECWTKNQWDQFRKWFNGHEDLLPIENNQMPQSISHWGQQSWGKYFASFITERDLYYVIPYISMSSNFADKGEHNRYIDSSHQVAILNGVKKNYKFSTFNSAIKYDLFFERIYSENIGGIQGKNICVDLNDHKLTTGDKDYLLTTQILNLPCICKFGLRLRPIDSNITWNVEGNEIKLYHCGKNYKLDSKTKFYPRLDYDFYGFSWKQVVKVGMIRSKRRVEHIISKVFSKRRR